MNSLSEVTVHSESSLSCSLALQVMVGGPGPRTAWVQTRTQGWTYWHCGTGHGRSFGQPERQRSLRGRFRIGCQLSESVMKTGNERFANRAGRRDRPPERTLTLRDSEWIIRASASKPGLSHMTGTTWIPRHPRSRDNNSATLDWEQGTNLEQLWWQQSPRPSKFNW